jgi:hypothetical protein
MSPLKNPFRQKITPDPARARIKEWAIAALGDAETLGLTLSEIDCGDPICPGLETIILVMREGEATQAVKIRKPMSEISQADVNEALRYV